MLDSVARPGHLKLAKLQEKELSRSVADLLDDEGHDADATAESLQREDNEDLVRKALWCAVDG